MREGKPHPDPARSLSFSCSQWDVRSVSFSSVRTWDARAIHAGLARKSETSLAATRQLRVCPLSIRLAGCETRFTFAHEADANGEVLRKAPTPPRRHTFEGVSLTATRWGGEGRRSECCDSRQQNDTAIKERAHACTCACVSGVTIYLLLPISGTWFPNKS